MKLTNRHGLAAACEAAVKGSAEEYQKCGWISATSLIAPVRVTLLRKRHDDEIEEDVADRIWMLLGGAVHYVLHQASKDGQAITEERFLLPFMGHDISMQPDRIESKPHTNPPEFILRDFKTTSIWSILLDTKKEWISQLNIYAYGCRKLGVNVTELVIEALIKDWSYGDWQKDKDRYPECQIMAVPIQLWTDAQCEEYLTRRVGEYEAAWDLADADLPLCTPEERWARPDKWAVQKIGAQRATKVCDTREEAERNQKAGMEVVHRPGLDVRCQRFCSVNRWCAYWADKQGIAVAEPQEF